MKRVKNTIGRYLAKMTVSVAMAAAFITTTDIPCFFALGEPKVPDVLLKLKEDKLGE